VTLTFTKVGEWRTSLGGASETTWDLTLDNSYPTQGYAVTGRQFGLSNNLIRLLPSHALIRGASQGTSAYIVEHDQTQATLRVFGGNATASAGIAFTEVPAGRDLSSYKVRVIAIGY